MPLPVQSVGWLGQCTLFVAADFTSACLTVMEDRERCAKTIMQRHRVIFV